MSRKLMLLNFRWAKWSLHTPARTRNLRKNFCRAISSSNSRLRHVLTLTDWKISPFRELSQNESVLAVPGLLRFLRRLDMARLSTKAAPRCYTAKPSPAWSRRPARRRRLGRGEILRSGCCSFNLIIWIFQTREFKDVSYVLEQAIRGDFAFVKAWRADKQGNLQFRLVPKLS